MLLVVLLLVFHHHRVAPLQTVYVPGRRDVRLHIRLDVGLDVRVDDGRHDYVGRVGLGYVVRVIVRAGVRGAAAVVVYVDQIFAVDADLVVYGLYSRNAVILSSVPRFDADQYAVLVRLLIFAVLIAAAPFNAGLPVAAAAGELALPLLALQVILEIEARRFPVFEFDVLGPLR